MKTSNGTTTTTPGTPKVLYSQNIASDTPADSIFIEGYKYKRGSYIALAILYCITLGTVHCIFHWKPRWKTWMFCERWPLRIASLLLVSNRYQQRQLSTISVTLVDPESDSTYRQFTYNGLRFVWSDTEGVFKRLNGLDTLTCAELKQLNNGIRSIDRSSLRQLYGSNNIANAIGKRSWIVLILARCFRPFHSILFLGVILWFLRDFIIYAASSLVILLTSIVVDTYFEISENRRIQRHANAMNTFSVTVLEDGLPKVISSADLVPGDVIVFPEEGFLKPEVTLPCDALVISGLAHVNQSFVFGGNDDLSLKVPIPNTNEIYSADTYRHSTIYCGSTLHYITSDEETNTSSGLSLVVLRTGINTTYGDCIRKTIYPPPMPYAVFVKVRAVHAILFTIGTLCFLFVLFFWAGRDGYNIDEVVLRGASLFYILYPPGLILAATLLTVRARSHLSKVLGVTMPYNASSAHLIGLTELICFDTQGTLIGKQQVVTGTISATCDTMSPSLCLNKSEDLNMNWALALCNTITADNDNLIGSPEEQAVFIASDGKFIGERTVVLRNNSTEPIQRLRVKPFVNPFSTTRHLDEILGRCPFTADLITISDRNPMSPPPSGNINEVSLQSTGPFWTRSKTINNAQKKDVTLNIKMSSSDESPYRARRSRGSSLQSRKSSQGTTMSKSSQSPSRNQSPQTGRTSRNSNPNPSEYFQRQKWNDDQHIEGSPTTQLVSEQAFHYKPTNDHHAVLHLPNTEVSPRTSKATESAATSNNTNATPAAELPPTLMQQRREMLAEIKRKYTERMMRLGRTTDDNANAQNRPASRLLRMFNIIGDPRDAPQPLTTNFGAAQKKKSKAKRTSKKRMSLKNKPVGKTAQHGKQPKINPHPHEQQNSPKTKEDAGDDEHDLHDADPEIRARATVFNTIRRFHALPENPKTTILFKPDTTTNAESFTLARGTSVWKQCLVPPDLESVATSFYERGFDVLTVTWKHLHIPDEDLKTKERVMLERKVHFQGVILLENEKPEPYLSSKLMPRLRKANIRSVIITEVNVFRAILIARESGIVPDNEPILLVTAYDTPVTGDAPQRKKCPRVDMKPFTSKQRLDVGPPTVPTESGQVFARVHYAVDGYTLRVLQEFYEDVYSNILHDISIFAAMGKPEASKVLEDLKDEYDNVAVCSSGSVLSDAARDHSLLSVLLSVNQKCIGATFIAHDSSPQCMLDLIRFGRASLTSFFFFFKYLIVNCLFQMISILLLHSLSTDFTDVQYAYMDIFVTGSTLVALAFSNEASPQLANASPLQQLMGFTNAVSIFFHGFAYISVQVGMLTHLHVQHWFEKMSKDDQSMWDAATLFILCSFQFPFLAICINNSKPHRLSIIKSYRFGFTLWLILLCNIILLFAPSKQLDDFFEIPDWGTQSFTVMFRIALVTAAVLSLLLGYIVERYILPSEKIVRLRRDLSFKSDSKKVRDKDGRNKIPAYQSHSR